MQMFRRLLPLAVLAVLLCGGAPAHGQQSLRSAAARLKAAVAQEEAKIADTREGLADAERRLSVLEARARQRRQQLSDTQDKLVAARVRLTRLERKQDEAENTLATNLRHNYMDGEPTFATVVLNADGFTDMVERFEFLRRIARRNASVLGDVRDARIKVKGMTNDLKALRTKYSALSREADEDADRADAIRTALLNREQAQLRKRDGAAAQLASVRNRIAAIERRQRAAARRAAMAASATRAAPSSGGGVSGTTGAGSGGGGDVVGRVIAAANEIATTPYVWGGGHGGASGGYDCSGSISYALAAGGLLNGSLDSTGFMSWGQPGPGRRITVYANAGHAFMVVDGRRYDTSALSGGGTRWTSAMRSTAGFVARHPPGL
jgi:peptidoglycan hydrolase CwlO-like protein